MENRKLRAVIIIGLILLVISIIVINKYLDIYYSPQDSDKPFIRIEALSTTFRVPDVACPGNGNVDVTVLVKTRVNLRDTKDIMGRIGEILDKIEAMDISTITNYQQLHDFYRALGKLQSILSALYEELHQIEDANNGLMNSADAAALEKCKEMLREIRQASPFLDACDSPCLENLQFNHGICRKIHPSIRNPRSVDYSTIYQGDMVASVTCENTGSD